MAAQIKERLTMQDVACHYGFPPNRSGFIRCPFHKGDRTPSLKLYSDGRWYCFGCNRGGSVIDFVMELYGIDFRQAVLRLNMDFGLGLVGHAPDPGARSATLEQRRREEQARRELEAEEAELSREHRYWWQISIFFAPEPKDRGTGWIHPLYAEAVNRLPRIEYRLEELDEKLDRMRRKQGG